MKREIKHLVLNTLLLLIIILGILFLYAPLDKNKDNQPKSSIQFVYQQF